MNHANHTVVIPLLHSKRNSPQLNIHTQERLMVWIRISVCMEVGSHGLLWKPGKHQMSSLVSLHLTFEDRVSYWTWSLPIWSDRLTSKLWGASHFFFLGSGVIDCISCPAFVGCLYVGSGPRVCIVSILPTGSSPQTLMKKNFNKKKHTKEQPTKQTKRDPQKI